MGGTCSSPSSRRIADSPQNGPQPQAGPSSCRQSATPSRRTCSWHSRASPCSSACWYRPGRGSSRSLLLPSQDTETAIRQGSCLREHEHERRLERAHGLQHPPDLWRVPCRPRCWRGLPRQRSHTRPCARRRGPACRVPADWRAENRRSSRLGGNRRRQSGRGFCPAACRAERLRGWRRRAWQQRWGGRGIPERCHLRQPRSALCVGRPGDLRTKGAGGGAQFRGSVLEGLCRVAGVRRTI